MAQFCLQDITLVTVDNPHTTKNLLKEAFPSAMVVMDVGHVLFSRLGKLFDKSHPLYSEYPAQGTPPACWWWAGLISSVVWQHNIVEAHMGCNTRVLSAARM